jgi:hypothetical protein
LKTVIRIIGITILLAVLAYAGIVGYYSCKPQAASGVPEVPKTEYRLTVKNTGLTLFSNKVVGEPIPANSGVQWTTEQLYIYSLPDGYYEVDKGKFTFKKVPLVLDERIFGKIEVRRP